MFALISNFDTFLDDVRDPKRTKIEPKIAYKSVLGLPGPPRDARGSLEASREPFWTFWDTILEQLWDPVCDHFEVFLQPGNPRLVRCSAPRFGCMPATQGRRVPALALTFYRCLLSQIPVTNRSSLPIMKTSARAPAYVGRDRQA